MAQPDRHHPVRLGSALPHHMATRAALCRYKGTCTTPPISCTAATCYPHPRWADTRLRFTTNSLSVMERPSCTTWKGQVVQHPLWAHTRLRFTTNSQSVMQRPWCTKALASPRPQSQAHENPKHGCMHRPHVPTMSLYASSTPKHSRGLPSPPKTQSPPLPCHRAANLC